MNKFILSGNLYEDPWIASSGKKMAIKLAVSKNLGAEAEKNAKAKGEKTADFFEVIVFNENRIKWLSKLRKGDGINCSGRIRNAPRQETQDRNGVPMIIVKDELVVSEIEITNLRSGNREIPEGTSIRMEDGDAEASAYEEADPIQATGYQPAPAASDSDEDW